MMKIMPTGTVARFFSDLTIEARPALQRAAGLSRLIVALAPVLIVPKGALAKVSGP